MTYREAYETWLKEFADDRATVDELKAIAGDEKEIEDRFYTELSFGTAGMRGVLGAGTNRMNLYNVRRATKGFADYINSQNPEYRQRGVVIAYDSRRMSPEFAKASALVLCHEGIHVYLFDELRPVPILSYAVRHLHAIAGIVITASHNPPEYNGYKVYWQHGGQAGPEQAAEILGYIRKADYFKVKPMEEGAALESGLLNMIGKEVDEAYYKATMSLRLAPEVTERHGAEMRIVYTPLHGSGNVPVREILRRIGIKNISVVKEQEEPDGSFPTVKAPNPEDPNAFTLAFDLANKTGADLILATDPDSDRLGAAVRRRDGRFQVLTGNQIGSILIHYILSTRNEQGTLPGNGLVVRSIVSTRMADAICAYYGVELREVLTGFRFISEQIAESLETKEHTFLFGFEESYGFLSGCFSRDKDAICAAMLLAEAATVYEFQESLYDVLQEIYEKYGFYGEAVKSYTLKGKEGLEKIAGAMRALRADKIAQFGGVRVVKSEDIQTGTITYPDGREEKCPLPKSNVLRYFTEGDGWLCVRPSGTEPKLKLYIGAKGSSEAELKAELSRLMTAADGMISELLK